MSVTVSPLPAYKGDTDFRGRDYNCLIFFQHPLTNFMIENATIDPKSILCCFRAIVLLLLASCVLRVGHLLAFWFCLLGLFFGKDGGS